MIKIRDTNRRAQVGVPESSDRYTHIQDILRLFKREPYTPAELGLIQFALSTAEKKSFLAEQGRPRGDYGAFSAEARSDDYKRLANVGVCIFTSSRPVVMEVVVAKVDETAGAVKGKPIGFRIFMRTAGASYIDLGRAPSLSLALKLARISVLELAESSPTQRGLPEVDGLHLRPPGRAQRTRKRPA